MHIFISDIHVCVHHISICIWFQSDKFCSVYWISVKFCMCIDTRKISNALLLGLYLELLPCIILKTGFHGMTLVFLI